jgi:hypothetical protein
MSRENNLRFIRRPQRIRGLIGVAQVPHLRDAQQTKPPPRPERFPCDQVMTGDGFEQAFDIADPRCEIEESAECV